VINAGFKRQWGAKLASILTLLTIFTLFGSTQAYSASDAQAKSDQLTQRLAPLLEQGDFQAALPLYVELIQTLEQTLDPDGGEMAANQYVLAEMYSITGQYDLALRWHQRTLEIREKVLGKDDLATAASLNGLANVYRKQGRYELALPLLQKTLEIRKSRLGLDHADTASSLSNLALIYEMQGQIDKALPMYRQALAVHGRLLGPDHPKTAITMSNLASVYETAGKYEDALELYEQAYQAFERSLGPTHPHTASSLNNLAALYVRLDQYDKALPLYKRALAIRENMLGGSHPDTALSLHNLASLLHSLGNYDQALPLYRRALAMREHTLGMDHVDTAATLNNLAGLYQDLTDHAKALPLLEQSLAVKERVYGSDNVETATTMSNLAASYVALGQPDKALPLLQSALSANEKILGSYHVEIAHSLVNLASAYQASGRPHDALPLLEQGLAAAGAAGVPSVMKFVQASLGSYYASAGNLPNAIIFYKMAVNTMQKIRSDSPNLSRELRQSLLKKNEQAYKELGSLLIQTGRLSEAHQVLSMLKEDEYYDFIRRDSKADPRVTRVAYTAAERPWAERLSGLTDSIGRLAPQRKKLGAGINASSTAQAADSQQTNILQQLASYGQQLSAALEQMSRMLPAEEARLADEERIAQRGVMDTVKQQLSQMGKSSVLLSYLMLGDKIRIVVTTEEQQIAEETWISESELYPKLVSFRKLLEDPCSDPRPLAEELYRILIKPVESNLKSAKTIMLSLDGALRYIPFAALYDGRGYLVQRYRLSLYTAAAQGKFNHAPPVKWKIAGMGVSRSVAGFAALPGVRQEMADVIRAGRPGSESYLDGKFTAKRMQASLNKDFSVLHVASHFQFIPGTESDSFLLLGDGSRLTLQSIREGDYRFDGLDLLTLSACATAMESGRGANGRDIEGLGVLAQRKGAKGVIASLWAIADVATPGLMKAFYRNREQRHLDKAAALQAAQLSLLQGDVRNIKHIGKRKPKADISGPFSHPFYWAPFILMGNWL